MIPIGSFQVYFHIIMWEDLIGLDLLKFSLMEKYRKEIFEEFVLAITVVLFRHSLDRLQKSRNIL